MTTKSIIPTVMFDSLLEQCALATYCETPEAHNLVNEEGLDFSKVESLKLEFQDILKITNLWNFVSLKELNLSNNRIEEIQGLEKLVNLVKLDLSFNFIEEISGLDALTNLTNLNLTSNRISKIKNLDNLNKLELLALRDNAIDNFETIQYLYTFRSVRSVSFHGNPISTAEDYHLKTIAFIPSLTYLDYRLISEEDKGKAAKKYADEISELEEHVKQIEKDKKDKQAKEETKILFSEAFLGNMNDNQFYEEILNCHEDSQKLYTFAGFADQFNEFSSSFRTAISEFIQVGLEEYELRKIETKNFTDASHHVINTALNACRDKVFDFTELKEDVFLKSSLWDEANTQKTELLQIARQQLADLWMFLMASELHLCYQLMDMKNLYFSVLEELVEDYSEKIKKHMENIRSCIDNFTATAITFYAEWSEKPTDEKMQVVKAASDYNAVDLELAELLKLDERSLQTILQEGLEARNTIIVDRENWLLSRILSWQEELVDNYYDNELERHRKHLREITYYSLAVKKELDML